MTTIAGECRGLRTAYVQTPNEDDLVRWAAAPETAPGDGSILRDLREHHAVLAQRGVPVVPLHPSDLRDLEGRLPSDEVFVSADLGVCWRLLDALGRTGRIVGSYPASLEPYLHRRWWLAKGEALASPTADGPVFVKPCRPRIVGAKRLRGRVVPSLRSLGPLPPVLDTEWFFCSEPVGWYSEYRCYVLHSRLLGIHPYRILGAGVSRVDCRQVEDLLPGLRPTDALLGEMIARLDAAGQSVAGYALDVGLTDRGDMALIEMNDGFALANNGLAPPDHLDLHCARWRELMTR
ncbi:ATP-grasp domain-containing protein [Methylobacterium tarhaniae]|uniref:ATP-grasp domain-containing protein n=1 Tax=Methylobacterium tarhaniae TaxID=1187852 RepID=UPI00069DA568|nr:ATP-grasp domain-containing protein [Methylobacterium tarhaniae]